MRAHDALKGVVALEHRVVQVLGTRRLVALPASFIDVECSRAKRAPDFNDEARRAQRRARRKNERVNKQLVTRLRDCCTLLCKRVPCTHDGFVKALFSRGLAKWFNSLNGRSFTQRFREELAKNKETQPFSSRLV